MGYPTAYRTSAARKAGGSSQGPSPAPAPSSPTAPRGPANDNYRPPAPANDNFRNRLPPLPSAQEAARVGLALLRIHPILRILLPLLLPLIPWDLWKYKKESPFWEVWCGTMTGVPYKALFQPCGFIATLLRNDPGFGYGNHQSWVEFVQDFGPTHQQWKVNGVRVWRGPGDVTGPTNTPVPAPPEILPPWAPFRWLEPDNIPPLRFYPEPRPKPYPMLPHLPPVWPGDRGNNPPRRDDDPYPGERPQEVPQVIPYPPITVPGPGPVSPPRPGTPGQPGSNPGPGPGPGPRPGGEPGAGPGPRPGGEENPNPGPRPANRPLGRQKPPRGEREKKYRTSATASMLESILKQVGRAHGKLADLRDILGAFNDALPKHLQLKGSDKKSIPKLAENMWKNLYEIDGAEALENVIKEIAEDQLGGFGDQLRSEASKKQGWLKNKIHTSPRF